MGNLLPNLLAVRHSRAPRDLKKEHPCQVNFLVGKHNVGEVVTSDKQATGAHRKNSEHFAHYLLTTFINAQVSWRPTRTIGTRVGSESGSES